MGHLHDEQYYIDLYDKHTVKRARDLEKHTRKSSDIPKPDNLKDVSGKVLQPWRKLVVEMSVNFMCAERMIDKPKVIQEWMNSDQEKDLMLASAIAPSHVHCPNCSAVMQPIDKQLFWHEHPTRKVLFMFECPKCQKKKGIYDTGEEWKFEVKCKRCQATVRHVDKRDGDIITTTYTCPMCGNSWQDTLELGKKDPEPDPNYDTDRRRFCYSDTVRKYADGWEQMQSTARFMKDYEARQAEESAVTTPKVQELNAAELETKLGKAIETEGYIRLEFGKPEFGRDVIVSFSAQDTKPDRKEYDSKNILKKLIIKTLDGSNWHLMTDGADYRMGFLSGRLKGSDKS